MTTKPFDQFNKQLFRELLSPFGQVFPNFAVLGEERAIDIFFVPHPGVVADADELGYLAEMSQHPALLEPFRSALLDEDVHNCMMKLFMVFADLQREQPTIEVTDRPKLWILAAEVSDRLLNDFAEPPDMSMMEGLYPLRKGLGTTIVAINELPVIPETFWLRLMGKGRTQDDAITELLMMPESDAKRRPALELLVSWRINMEVLEQVELEERRILMALSQVYVEWEKQTEARGAALGEARGVALGEARGEARGLEQERKAAIEGLMLARFGAIDPDLLQLIPILMKLNSAEYTKLLVDLSREELLQHFN
jgi:hypothetical protein